MKDNLIGKSIKINRIAQNYTQKQLAQKIGVTHAAISYWENGVNICLLYTSPSPRDTR